MGSAVSANRQKVSFDRSAVLPHLPADLKDLVENLPKGYSGLEGEVQNGDQMLEFSLSVRSEVEPPSKKRKSVRQLSLPKAVAAAGGIEVWNARTSEVAQMKRMLTEMCRARTVAEALEEVEALLNLGHNLWAYAYMRTLYNRNLELYYETLLAKPALLLPVVYTPTVGEACQKFGKLPMGHRGCYCSIADQGKLKEVLQEYAEAELDKDPETGKFLVDCIVFSDGGRILGLGDLGAWGMGIPIGKLDLYTVCAGVNPYRTIPVIIDAGCSDKEGNTEKLIVRDHPLYTGLRQDRKTHTSAEGTKVNTPYYGETTEKNLIKEFMEAATELFGTTCLLQFEDFNSNDAFPLLAEQREKFLCYNDDIQGTAAVTVAGLLGAMRLRSSQDPSTDLVAQLREQTFLFHGAGSANLGAAKLLIEEAGVPATQVLVTNSRGLIWRSEDGSQGSFRNNDQKAFAQIGEPTFNSKDLVTLVKEVKPTCLVGAVGVSPNCFTKQVIEALLEVEANKDKSPVVFALSNPKTQAEITFENAMGWSKGRVIYGSGTAFPPVELEEVGRREPGQVNNVYVFPGMSFGAISCQAEKIPEVLFMVAAEAVAQTLSETDLSTHRVVPHPDRLREVGLNVATAVAMKCQDLGLARKTLGKTKEEVKAALEMVMWAPQSTAAAKKADETGGGALAQAAELAKNPAEEGMKVPDSLIGA